MSFSRIIVCKHEIWGVPELDSSRQFAPEVRADAAQRSLGCAPGVRIVGSRVVDPRLLQVLRYANMSHGDVTDTGVPDVPREQEAQLLSEEVSDALGSGAVGHERLSR